MNMVKRRKFDKQFKLEVVQRSLDENITLTQLSEELEIRLQTLRLILIMPLLNFRLLQPIPLNLSTPKLYLGLIPLTFLTP